jgi:predicted DNA-binding transcriptional regulator YafY
MPRSTDTQKARRLNAAYGLLVRGLSVADMTLSSDFAISRRQAYRYVRQARTLDAPLPVIEPAIAVTVKLPGDVARQLRAHAASSGLTQGEIVGRALEAFIAQARDRA